LTTRFREEDLDDLLAHQEDRNTDEYEEAAEKHSRDKYTAHVTFQVLACDIDIIEDCLGDLITELVAKAKRYKQEMVITDYFIDEVEPSPLD
jgi:hypothetical protein